MADEARRPGESILAHRARLKADRQREAVASAGPQAEPSAVQPEADAETSPPPRRLTDADMPPVETLTAESDFSQFLAEGVSDTLRRAALRKLFHLPQFQVLDGLNDYDEDYTQFEKLGDVITYHQRRMQAREEAERLAQAEAAPGTSGADSGKGEAAAEEVPGEPGPEEPADVDHARGQGEAIEDDGDLQA